MVSGLFFIFLLLGFLFVIGRGVTIAQTQTAQPVATGAMHNPTQFVVTTLLLGLGFNWLIVHDQPFGLGMPIYVGLLLAGFIFIARTEKLKELPENRWIVALIIFFAVMLAVRDNAMLKFLNFSAVTFLLGYYFYGYGSQKISEFEMSDYISAPILMGLFSVFGGGKPIQEAIQAMQSPQEQQTPRRYFWAVVRGLLLSLPILLIFAMWLSSADPIFSQLLRDWFNLPELAELAVRGMIILVVTWLLLGIIRVALEREEKRIRDKLNDINGDSAETAIKKLQLLGAIEAIVMLNAVNLLFVTFVWVQFTHLFGGKENIVDGYTYADYARRGFAELVIVSVGTLGLIWLLKTITRRESQRQTMIYNLSSTLTTALTIVILLSAFQRLRLYELTYGFTEMRLYPHVFMVWLAILFVWFVITLWIRPKQFLFGVLICGIGYIVTLNIINPDAFIVRQNWQRFHAIEVTLNGIENGNATTSVDGTTIEDVRRLSNEELFDSYYLYNLSYDSIPTLVDISKEAKGNLKTDLYTYLDGKKASLENQTTWQSWQWSRWQAKRSLAAIK